PTKEEPSSPKIVLSSSQPTRKYSTRTGVAKEVEILKADYINVNDCRVRQNTLWGPNGHGVVEVKAKDFLQGIAQNIVQCESILLKGRNNFFKIIIDSENGNPTSSYQRHWLLFM
ncbi:1856_t:CDS:2, partial [Dentiscutata heterogama]